ncbi:MAG: metallophosphoesterase [Tissierellia bacterium]|nr:metallophosphoesterase [Tissierellia bacterium]
MRIAILSDTHGKTEYFLSQMRKRNDIDKIIHLGDFAWDAELIKDELSIPVIYVKGNNDFGSDAPLDKVIYLEGHKVWLTHGHRYNVYFGVDSLFYRAKEVGADIVMYGHTHSFFYEITEGIRFLNPGSLSHSRGDGHTSYVIMDITNKDVRIERIIEK